MKSLVQKIGFPVIYFGCGMCFIASNFNPIVAYVILGGCMLLSAWLERYLPFAEEWNVPQQDIQMDVGYFALSFVVNSLTTTLSILSVGYIAAQFGLPKLTTLYNLPFAIQIIIAMILSGFLPYWVHRLSHEHDNFLWRVHSVHHSPERLYWLNALRLHPLNVFWNVYLSLFPLQFLGFGEEVIVTVGILNNIVNIYNHANINFKLGWLNWVFNMSELHRWHHSKAIEEANHNYSAGSLIFWDLVFGTYLHPEQQLLPKHVGLSTDSNYPTRSFYKLLLYPFCRCAG